MSQDGCFYINIHYDRRLTLVDMLRDTPRPCLRGIKAPDGPLTIYSAELIVTQDKMDSNFLTPNRVITVLSFSTRIKHQDYQSAIQEPALDFFMPRGQVLFHDPLVERYFMARGSRNPEWPWGYHALGN